MIQFTSDISLDLVTPLCTSCYGEPQVGESTGTTLGGRCLDIESAINVYKSEHGIKPRWMSDDELIEWLAKQSARTLL